MQSTSILDVDDALDRLGGDTSLYTEVAAIFLEDFSEQMNCIQAESSNPEDIARAFHSVAGSAGNIGARDLSALSKQMESQISSKGVSSEELEKYTDLASRTIESVKKVISELS